jgi:hypothetical protein
MTDESKRRAGEIFDAKRRIFQQANSFTNKKDFSLALFLDEMFEHLSARIRRIFQYDYNSRKLNIYSNQLL